MKKIIFKILTICLILLTKPLLANTDQEYINEYKPEIDKFIIDSNLYNKDVSEYKIGSWNEYFYITDTFHDFVLLKPTLEGLQNVFQLDANYSISDIKVEKFFDDSNLTFIRKTGGVGIQVHEKHILYIENNTVENFNFDEFANTSTGSLAFDSSYLETLGENDNPFVNVEKKIQTELLNGFIYFYETILIESNHLEQYVNSRGYKDLERFYDYDYQLGILEFKPILSTIIFEGGFGGGAPPFVVLHECNVQQFKPEIIEKCFSEYPISLRGKENRYTINLPNEKIGNISDQDLELFADKNLSSSLIAFKQDYLDDFHAFKEAFYNYGSDLDFVVNFDILSIGDDIRIITYKSRTTTGVSGRATSYFIYKKNNMWVKLDCTIGNHGYHFFVISHESKKSLQVITPTKWNELDSCTINK